MISSYILLVIITAYLMVKWRMEYGYIDIEDVFAITAGSLLFPVGLILLALDKFHEVKGKRIWEAKGEDENVSTKK